MEAQEGGRGRKSGAIRRFKESALLLVLDPPDGLNLRSLGVGAKFTVTLVLSSATVALHDVLVATVARVLVAHKAAGKHTHRHTLESGKQSMLSSGCVFFSCVKVI